MLPLTKDISIIVLCYQSEKRVLPIIKELESQLKSVKKNWEMILVANDYLNSQDNTKQIIQELNVPKDKFKKVLFEKKGSYGWDVKSGLDVCTGKIIVIFDADGQVPVEAVGRGLQCMFNEKVDAVFFHRVGRKDGIFRSIVSLVFNKITKLLFPFVKIKDINAKPKIFKHLLLNNIKLTASHWFIDCEFVVQFFLQKKKFKELPVSFDKLTGRKSNVRISDILYFFVLLLVWRIRIGLNQKKKTD